MKLYDESGELIHTSNEYNTYDEGSYEYYYYQQLAVSLERGTYYLAVEVTDDYYDLSNQAYFLYQWAEFSPDFSIESFKANLSSPQLENKTISFQASSKTAGLQYQFSINNKVLQEFGTSSSFKWKPSKAGSYTIKVEARNPNYPYAVISKELKYNITAYKPDFKITSLTSSSKYIIQNKQVTLSTKTDKSKLQYQYTINDKVVQKFGSKATYNWKPTKAGKYKVKVEVRRAEYPNAVVVKAAYFQVYDGNVKITALKPSLSSPRPYNKTIKWTASSHGVDLQYKFSVYSNKKWVTIKNYSSTRTVNWKPTKAGTYKVRVDVWSKASGKKAYKVANYTVFKPSDFSITSFTANKKSPQTAGTYLTYTAKAKGAYLEYQFRVNNGYGWYTAQDYSTKNTFSTYPYTGNFRVAVNVRQKGTTKVKQKIVSIQIKENPSYYMRSNYEINYNYGWLTVNNYGYKNLKVTKYQLINNDKVIYTYTPKDWIVIGRDTETFYYYPNKKVTSFNYYTYWKITYTYDGMQHTAYLYR